MAIEVYQAHAVKAGTEHSAVAQVALYGLFKFAPTIDLSCPIGLAEACLGLREIKTLYS